MVLEIGITLVGQNEEFKKDLLTRNWSMRNFAGVPKRMKVKETCILWGKVGVANRSLILAERGLEKSKIHYIRCHQSFADRKIVLCQWLVSGLYKRENHSTHGTGEL